MHFVHPPCPGSIFFSCFASLLFVLSSNDLGRKKKSETGSTPDAVLLAPRATERFLRPVKPAGCAQGSKNQQIPGQLSGDSDSANGHTEPRTLQIFQKVNYRLTDSIRWAFRRSTIRSFRSWVARASVHACAPVCACVHAWADCPDGPGAFMDGIRSQQKPEYQSPDGRFQKLGTFK